MLPFMSGSRRSGAAWVLGCVLLALSATTGSVRAEPGGGQHGGSGHGGQPHWTYDGEAGAGKWGELSPDFALCRTGKAQSPINIVDARPDKAPNIGTDYQRIPLKILNNGHTIQVDYASSGVASLGGVGYRLAQFHFHTPSEHRINGKAYPMEVHLVHKDEHGGLAVIGVMFQRGKKNDVIEELWKQAPDAADKSNAVAAQLVDASRLLPKNKSYYHYRGSLTTPPCSEGVKWYVLKQAIEVSDEQVAKLKALFRHNERPVQPLNGRDLTFVEDDGKPVAIPALAAPSAGAGHQDGGHGASTGGKEEAHGASAGGAAHAAEGAKTASADSRGSENNAKASGGSWLWWIAGIVAALVLVAAVVALVAKKGGQGMFGNLKIGARLALGFGLVLLLLTVISVFAVSRLSLLNGEINDIVKDKFPKTVLANDIIDQINTQARSIRSATVANLTNRPADMKAELDKIPPARQLIIEKFDQLDKMIRSEAGIKVLAKAHEARKAYIADQDKFIDLMSGGKKEVAAEFLLNTIRKTQGEYLKVMNDLIDFQTDLMSKSGEEADHAASQATNVVIGLAVAAFFIGVLFAWFVTRSITRPLNDAVAVADQLAQGDLTAHISTTARDETGLLLRSMGNMVGKLSSIIGEVNGAAEALNNAAGQVSQTAQSLSQSSSEQAAGVEETTSSMEQMTASITQNTENAKVTDNMATKSATEAEQGGRSKAA